MAKPAVGVSFVDPDFHTTIRRITDASAIGKSYVKTMYSTQPAWNADESLLLLLSSGYEHVLYDGKTYKFIRNISSEITPSDGEQVMWDTLDPHVISYAESSSHKFVKYDVITKVRTELHDFSTAPTSCTSKQDLSLGTDPMYGAWSGGRTGLTCGSKNWVYDSITNTVYQVNDLATYSSTPQLAYVVTPSGSKVFLSFDPNGTGNAETQVRDLNGHLLRTIAKVNSSEHGSLGTYANGHDAYFGVQFDSFEGLIIGADLETGSVVTHVGVANGWPYPPNGTHVSALATRNPGWVVASSIGPVGSKLGQGVLENELVLANVNTGSVCRIAHLRSAASGGYFSEPHPIMSPTATRIAFNSDWFGEPGTDVYVVELPAYHP